MARSQKQRTGWYDVLVIILERVTPGLRGELTRWLLEPKSGVYVGHVSAMVRERLWERVCKGLKSGAATLVYSSDTEQGYALRNWGDTSRLVESFDGIALVRVPLPKGEEELATAR